MEEVSLRSIDQFAWEQINPNYSLETNSLFNSFDFFFDHENPIFSHDYLNNEFFYDPLLLGYADHDFVVPQFSSDNSSNFTTTSLDFNAAQLDVSHQDCAAVVTMMEGEDLDVIGTHGGCKTELVQSPSVSVPRFEVGACPDRKRSRAGKALMGQPSKNLMAERRRRKRLNDRLSMLRSIVPKISKMDRTSILGDTIDYMKEMLERINNLQQEIDRVGSDQLDILSMIKEAKASNNQIIIRNSPKFEVERRDLDTKVEISCAEKPGLLLSTLTTLEALGLEIQHCVISCFNDFSMQASCSEEMEQRMLISSEEVKQALFRSAGYEGRCI